MIALLVIDDPLVKKQGLDCAVGKEVGLVYIDL
jgi:hypothetical protein